MTRTEAIKELKSIIRAHKIMKTKDKVLGDAFIDRKIRALEIALESLEIDEIYQLMEEETDDQTDNSNPGI